MQTKFLSRALAVALVFAAPAAAYASRGQEDSGTSPNIYASVDQHALQVEAQDWNNYLAQHPAFAAQLRTPQASNPSSQTAQ